ncbi:MAG: hypothetical protein J2P16_00020 [Mycobacterium sp.]|nr:hypothetical protein [Mycobacterium sp.]
MSARYVPEEKEMWWYVPEVDDISAPTVAEINAGTEMTCAIKEVTGFSAKSDSVEGPDLCSRVVSKFPGKITLDDSQITFYKSSVETDVEEIVRALLPRDTSGFVLRFHPKDHLKQVIAADSTCEVWPVTVSSNLVEPPKPGELVTYIVGFTATTEPDQDATLAA